MCIKKACVFRDPSLKKISFNTTTTDNKHLQSHRNKDFCISYEDRKVLMIFRVPAKISNCLKFTLKLRLNSLNGYGDSLDMPRGIREVFCLLALKIYFIKFAHFSIYFPQQFNFNTINFDTFHRDSYLTTSRTRRC